MRDRPDGEEPADVTGEPGRSPSSSVSDAAEDRAWGDLDRAEQRLMVRIFETPGWRASAPRQWGTGVGRKTRLQEQARLRWLADLGLCAQVPSSSPHPTAWPSDDAAWQLTASGRALLESARLSRRAPVDAQRAWEIADDRSDFLRRREDCLRRGAMLWMLRERGAKLAQIARALGLSGARIEQVASAHRRTLARRIRVSRGERSDLIDRLRRAGAILDPPPGAPPSTWRPLLLRDADLPPDWLGEDQAGAGADRVGEDRLGGDRLGGDRLVGDRLGEEASSAPGAPGGVTSSRE